MWGPEWPYFAEGASAFEFLSFSLKNIFYLVMDVIFGLQSPTSPFLTLSKAEPFISWINSRLWIVHQTNKVRTVCFYESFIFPAKDVLYASYFRDDDYKTYRECSYHAMQHDDSLGMPCLPVPNFHCTCKFMQSLWVPILGMQYWVFKSICWDMSHMAPKLHRPHVFPDFLLFFVLFKNM